MSVETVALYWIIPLLTICAAVTCVRVIVGPSLPDRVVAFDLLSAVGIAIIVAYAIATGKYFYVDVAIAVALVSFLGTVAFARYIERSL